jgi:hypothetical protein
MITARAVAAAAILAILACRAPATDDAPDSGPVATASHGPIFRHLQLADARIELGEPLPSSLRASLGLSAGDTIASLPRGAFAGAERITLHLTPQGALRGVVFDYILSRDFEAMVREYSATLGAPVRRFDRRPGEEPAEHATWDDGRTIFRILRDPNRSAWTVRAELRDLPGAGP